VIICVLQIRGTVGLERGALYYMAYVILVVKVPLKTRACISSAAGGDILADNVLGISRVT
jgi:hypothetical protein